MGDSLLHQVGHGAGSSSNMSGTAGSASRKDLTLEYLDIEVRYNRSRINMIETKLENLETPMRRTFSASVPEPTAGTRTEVTDDSDMIMRDYMVLTSAKTIPEVRECNFVTFKNRFNRKGKDGRYAVDVLVSGPLLHQEIQEEHQLRDKLFSKKPPKLSTRIVQDPSLKTEVNLAQANAQLMAEVQSDDLKWPRRIRLQSPALIRMLAIANREKWTDRQRTYHRPFNALIYHHPKMREILRDLEARWGTQVDAEQNNNTAGVELPPEDEETESNGPDVEEDEDSDEIIDSPLALKCLRAYVKYIDEKILPDYHRYENMDINSDDANVRFSDLWYLFRTGELVYRQVDGELPDRRDFRTGKRIWKTFYVDPIPEREMAAFTDDDEIRDTATKNDEKTFRLGCYYIDYNGEEFVCVKTEVKIEQFQGEMPINGLPVYPMRFCQDWQGRLAHAIKTGEDLVRFIGEKHCSYNGWTLTRDPSGESTTDVKGNKLEQPEHINSEVMVDFGEAFQQCPSWRPPRASMREKIVDGLTLPEEFKIRWWSGEDRAILLGETTEQIPVRSGVTWKQRNTFVANDPFLSKVSSNVQRGEKTTVEHLNLGEDTKALLTGRVFAYVFQERKFAQLAVAKLRPSPQTGLPLHSLKIPDPVKHAIQGSIQGHFRQKNAERKIDQDWVSLDLIEGKGSGLFILLHGVPGVGKTATAEAIAKANGRPLFKITVGDLGMTPENLETSLREIFRLASIWDCILLLDEVDTFFSARSKADTATKKNGLVSEFLRVLDYYDGILFLTTNRAGVLDEAFKSRIHYKIYYPNLSLEQTLDIWKLNIQRTRQIEDELCKAEGRHPLHINEDELLAFARHHFEEGVKSGKGGHWNGRQIRNAFQVARSLAYYEHGIREEQLAAKRRSQAEAIAAAGAPVDLRDGGVMLSGPPTLDVSHFRTMHEITASFEKYCNSTRGGYTDAEIALENEYRQDRFKDHLTENLQNEYRESFYRNNAAAGDGTVTTDTVTDVLVHQHQHQLQRQPPNQQPQQQQQQYQPNQQSQQMGFQQQQQYEQQRQALTSSPNDPRLMQQQSFQGRMRSNSHRSMTGMGSPPPNITFDSQDQQTQQQQQQQQPPPTSSLFLGQPPSTQALTPRQTQSRESLNINLDPSSSGNTTSNSGVGYPGNTGRPRSSTGASSNFVPSGGGGGGGAMFPGQGQAQQPQYGGTPPRSINTNIVNNNNNNNPNMYPNQGGSQGGNPNQLGMSPAPRGPSPAAMNIPIRPQQQGGMHRDSFGSNAGSTGSYGTGPPLSLGQFGQQQQNNSQEYTYQGSPNLGQSQFSAQQGGSQTQYGGGGGGGAAGSWNAGPQGRYLPASFNTGMGGGGGGGGPQQNVTQYQEGYLRAGGGFGGVQQQQQEKLGGGATDLTLDDPPAPFPMQ